ncbi:MAG: Rieske 2Fe-2S domain-containing protein [Gaiellales bacterium]
MTDDRRDQETIPTPSLWPAGFAVGVACALVGLFVSVPVLIAGLAVALIFGVLWAVQSARGPVPSAPEAAAGLEHPPETYGRGAFLTAATVGLGGVIGAGVTLPSLGFAVLPSFVGDSVETHDVDLGPISNYPEGEYVIATYMENPDVGEVTRRTAFIRNNGFTESGKPSFTALFSRCVHLGCPVQPNGPIDEEAKKDVNGVELRPVLAASFGCPCHGGQYDSEGNRTAGPPVRSLDRFEFSIKNGNLVLGRLFSVGSVEGTGARAKITKYYQAYPGVHVDGPERFLYPIPTPGTRR